MPEGADAAFFEPPEEDRANLLAMQTITGGQVGPFGAPAATPSPAPKAGPADNTPKMRPRQRPPMALLCVLHDGDHGGEWIALRTDRFVIGRVDGDLRIPHDGQISGRHAEIVRTNVDNAWRWHLADVGSTNGTFVRIAKVGLQHGHELLFGQTRYRFDDLPPAAPPPPPPPPTPGNVTMRPGAPITPWTAAQAATTVPALVEVTPTGDGARVSFVRTEYWLGRDPDTCAVVPRDDPFVSPRHARFYRGSDGRWRIENNRSANGLWLRISQAVPVDGTCQFLLGEQRFILKAL